MQRGEKSDISGSASHDDLLVYPLYLPLQIEIGLEDLLGETPTADRVAEAPAHLMRALASQRPVGIVARQRSSALDAGQRGLWLIDDKGPGAASLFYTPPILSERQGLGG